MDVIRRSEARIRHRGAYALGDVGDLSQAPEAFEGERRGARMANGERARFRRRRDVTGFEDHEMRREGPLRPAGHHELDPRSGVARPAPVEHVLQRTNCETAREIVDAAIALRLAENGDDRVWINRAGGDGRLQPRNIVRRAHCDAMDEGLPRQGRASMKAFDEATAPNTPPCIVTILSAAA